MGKYATAFKQSNINDNYIIRYYPDSNDRHNNQLIGKKKFYEILKDYRTRKGVMKRIKDNKDNSIEIRLRRGIMFQIVQR